MIIGVASDNFTLSASEVTTLRRYTNLFIIIIIISRGAKYCDHPVCVPVCPLLCLESDSSNRRQIFCGCCLGRGPILL